MKKLKKLGMFFCICVMMFTACGKTEVPEKAEQNTLVIDKDGTIHSYLVENFEKGYYDVPALTRMAMEEASQFNDNNKRSDSEKAAVVVDKIEQSADGGRIYVNYTFADGDALSGFAEEYCDGEYCGGGMLFFGTVKEAADSGHRLDAAAFTNVKDGSMTTGSAVEQNAADKHILITDQKVLIYCPYEVSHVGEGAVWLEKGIVDTTNAGGKVFILMKK